MHLAVHRCVTVLSLADHGELGVHQRIQFKYAVLVVLQLHREHLLQVGTVFAKYMPDMDDALRRSYEAGPALRRVLYDLQTLS